MGGRNFDNNEVSNFVHMRTYDVVCVLCVVELLQAVKFFKQTSGNRLPKLHEMQKKSTEFSDRMFPARLQLIIVFWTRLGRQRFKKCFGFTLLPMIGRNQDERIFKSTGPKRVASCKGWLVNNVMFHDVEGN